VGLTILASQIRTDEEFATKKAELLDRI